MAQQKKVAKQDRGGMTEVDRVRLRVSAMINSPKAQSLRQVTLWRLDSDSESAWRQVMEELAETDGLSMTENEDGTMLLQWEAMAEEGPEVQMEDWAPIEDMQVQNLVEAPF
ncbi:DUF1654 domain-containing protein [Metapseudomonas sp. CR1201]